MENKEIKLLYEKAKEKGLPVNIHNGDLFLNCSDTQCIAYNGRYHFMTVGGSRYFYSETYAADEIEQLIEHLERIASKTNEQIDKEYRSIAHLM